MAYVWCLSKWKKYIEVTTEGHKCGLRMRYEYGVNPEVRKQLDKFVKWLRQEFIFPLRLNVYVKQAKYIMAKDGDVVVGTICLPANYTEYPYIRLATGDYLELVEELGRDKAILAILHTFAHELTHYYQHINNLALTKVGEERQAEEYADDIVLEYVKVLDRGDKGKTGDSSLS